MQVRVLGCSGAIAKDCRTTAFLIDGRILVDAGTGVGDLTLEEMQEIDHVFLSHAHLDHIAALPLMLDAVASQRPLPLTVHALPETIEALKSHIFNGVIWPDFSCIPSPSQPFLRYESLATGARLVCEGLEVEVLPAAHTVPAVGYAVRGTSGWWVYTGDTGPNPDLWSRLNQFPDMAALVIEAAFSRRESLLAARSQHLSSESLWMELEQWTPCEPCPVYVTHSKPLEAQQILEEIRALAAQWPTQAARPDIFWLRRDQLLDI